MDKENLFKMQQTVASLKVEIKESLLSSLADIVVVVSVTRFGENIPDWPNLKSLGQF